MIKSHRKPLQKIREFNDNLEIYLTSDKEIAEAVIVFSFSAICTFTLFISGYIFEIFNMEMIGFSMLIVTILFMIWAYITIYYDKKREKNITQQL